MDEEPELTAVRGQDRRLQRHVGPDRFDGENADRAPLLCFFERLPEVNRKQFCLRFANFRIDAIGNVFPIGR